MRQWVGWSCMGWMSWNFGRRPMDGKRHRFVPGAYWRAPPLPSLSMVCLPFHSLGRSWPKLPSKLALSFSFLSPIPSYRSSLSFCLVTSPRVPVSDSKNYPFTGHTVQGGTEPLRSLIPSSSVEPPGPSVPHLICSPTTPFVRFSPRTDFLRSWCFWVFSCLDYHPDFHSTPLPVRRVRSRPAFPSWLALLLTQTGHSGLFYQPRKKKRSTRSLRLFPSRHQRLDSPDVLAITTNFAGVSSGRYVPPFFGFDNPTKSQADRPSAVTVDDCSLETNDGLFPFSRPQASFNSTVSPTVEGFLSPRPPFSPFEDRQVRDPVASVLPLPHFLARNKQLRGVVTPRAWSG
ncbi:hypothetical protein F5144DRAFT_285687 [Chaetomium tenue]|uniref:Uncharacterized protein n=1 Tax=Chaetomium tenue TaxID=1854479 RepID=A0ACB7P3R0_9PEZI|nr:hypothetical protein F5144DRAFT_285687 [Chaetomium globosum]